MLGSIGKQSGESVESALKKKKGATVGRICRKGEFQAWNERVRGDGSINVSSTTTVATRAARSTNATTRPNNFLAGDSISGSPCSRTTVRLISSRSTLASTVHMQ